MRHFPIFLDLRGLQCLVAGGGPVGARRAAALARAGARVRIVAPEFSSAARALARRPSVRLVRRRFRASDVQGCALVIAATGDRRADTAIARAARRRRIFCNVAGDPALGTFIVPAVARRGGVAFAVSTGGASPLLARALADAAARAWGRVPARARRKILARRRRH